MKLQIVAALGLGLLIASPLQAQDKKAEKPADKKADASGLKNQKEKVSYSIGINIGKNFKQQGVDFDLNAFVNGIKDGSSGKEGLLTEAEMQEVMMAFQKEMMAKQSEKGEKSKKEGDAFLAENKKKEGVKTTESGLQYKVIKMGTGPKPSKDDTVETNYKGTLVDGTEFDSSYKRKETATFPVTGVIPGWTEALQMMPVGSKWQLFIPSDLAYGSQGQGPIPANAPLIFEIELISIKKDK